MRTGSTWRQKISASCTNWRRARGRPRRKARGRRQVSTSRARWHEARMVANRRPSLDTERFNVGERRRRDVLGDAYVDRSLSNADDFNRPFQELVTEYCWGTCWGDPTLAPRERSLLNLGMIAALGKMHEFELHVRGALKNGIS